MRSGRDLGGRERQLAFIRDGEGLGGGRDDFRTATAGLLFNNQEYRYKAVCAVINGSKWY